MPKTRTSPCMLRTGYPFSTEHWEWRTWAVMYHDMKPLRQNRGQLCNDQKVVSQVSSCRVYILSETQRNLVMHCNHNHGWFQTLLLGKLTARNVWAASRGGRLRAPHVENDVGQHSGQSNVKTLTLALTLTARSRSLHSESHAWGVKKANVS